MSLVTNGPQSLALVALLTPLANLAINSLLLGFSCSWCLLASFSHISSVVALLLTSSALLLLPDRTILHHMVFTATFKALALPAIA